MHTYIVFLRAVNVSGKNIIKMIDLKKHLDDANFKQVKTYIQSGNIILKSELNKIEIQSKIQQLIKQHFDLTIDVFVLSSKELLNIIDNNPFPGDLAPNKVYFTLLADQPEQEYVYKLAQIDLGAEQYVLVNNILYSYAPEGMANAKLSNTFIESKLKVKATGRNLNTITKIKEMALEIN